MPLAFIVAVANGTIGHFVTTSFSMLRSLGLVVPTLLVWLYPSFAQMPTPIHQEVRWQHRQPEVRLDSLGHDYSFVGMQQRAKGQLVYFSRLLPVTNVNGLEPVVQQAEYGEAPFRASSLPDWLREPTASQATLISARGQYAVRVTLPAFRTNGAGVQILKGYTIAWQPLARHATRSNPFPCVTNSVLAQGHWEKIAVQEEGMYRITYGELRQQGFADPLQVSLWGRDGKQLSYYNDPSEPDDLQQIPLQWYHAVAGQARDDDYAVAYLAGYRWWAWSGGEKMYLYHQHETYTQAFYFLTDSRPPQAPEPVSATPPPQYTQSTFWGVSGYQGQREPPVGTGRKTFGEAFPGASTRTISTGLLAPTQPGAGKVFVELAARSLGVSNFALVCNGQPVGQVAIPGLSAAEQKNTAASLQTASFSIPQLGGGELVLEVVYHPQSASATAWLNRLSVNARMPLRWQGNALFAPVDSVGPMGLNALQVEAFGEGVEAWDVSNIFRPRRFLPQVPLAFPAALRGRVALFTTAHDLRSVEFCGPVRNQNLHALQPPELLIVTHEALRAQADALANIYRHSLLGKLTVEVVEVHAIYNEFSAGRTEAAAIRNLIRMLYWRGGGATGPLKYVLLLGNAYYKLSEIDGPNSLVPNHLTENSYDDILSFGSDDFFCLLDPGEGEYHGGLDIALGRYPVRSEAEAEAMLRHERAFHGPKNWGPWLSRALFLADDEDNLLYMKGSEDMAQQVEHDRPTTTVLRFYADAFKQDNRWYRTFYPSLKQAIQSEVQRGTLLFNYMGHGSISTLMREEALGDKQLPQWRNLARLPIMVAASCNVAKYDMLEDEYSFAVRALMHPQGGLVALIGATRYTFAGGNADFNKALVAYIHPPVLPPHGLRLGDALLAGKAATADEVNRAKYVLLGNPALPLLNPNAQVNIATLNGATLSSTTLLAPGEAVEMALNLANDDGSPFNGQLYLELQGGKDSVVTQANDYPEPFIFMARTRSYFRGMATVSNGKATLRWIMPPNTSGPLQEARMSLFAASKGTLAVNSYEHFKLGGAATTALQDDQGPEIELFLNDFAHRADYKVGPNPLLLAKLRDASGINIDRAAVGHSIELRLERDGKEIRKVDLSDYYTAQADTYQQGTLEYQLFDLEAGHYRLLLSASDIASNRTTATLEFTVVPEGKATIEHLLNYPNPFTDYTAFYFDLTNADRPMEVMVQIFTIDGTLVKTLRASPPASERIGPIYWDGRDEYGQRLARGVYFYRVQVVSFALDRGDKEFSERYERLVIL